MKVIHALSIAHYERKSKFDSSIEFTPLETIDLGKEIKRVSKRLYKKAKSKTLGIQRYQIIQLLLLHREALYKEKENR